LIFRASPSAFAPSYPISFHDRSNVVRDELIFRASASAFVPSSPILLSPRYNVVRDELIFRASPSAFVRSSPIRMKNVAELSLVLEERVLIHQRISHEWVSCLV